jgi:integrase/recombinase XerD
MLSVVPQENLEKNVIVKWLEQFKSEDTKRTYDSVVRNYFGVDDIKDVTDWRLKLVKYEHVQSYILDMIKDEKCKNTVKKNLFALRSMFEYAVDVGVLKENVFADKKIKKLLKYNLVKGEEVKGIALTKSEIKEFLDKVNDRRDKIMFGFMFRTGLRVSEVVGVKMRDVVVKNGESFLKVLGKGNKIRYVFVSDGLVEEMKSLVENDNEIIFDMDSSNVNKRLRGYSDVLSAHDFRRTCCTNLLIAGVPIKKVQEFMGHSDIRTTMKYAREIGLFEDNAGRAVSW